MRKTANSSIQLRVFFSYQLFSKADNGLKKTVACDIIFFMISGRILSGDFHFVFFSKNILASIPVYKKYFLLSRSLLKTLVISKLN